MRRVQRWRYYCDFCTKANQSSASIARHEKHCTLNPDRECRMCRLDGTIAQESIATLVRAIRENGLPTLREAASGCPACMLAAIRQDRIQRGVDLRTVASLDLETTPADFDYKAESEAWFRRCVQERNDEIREVAGGCF